MRKYYNKYCLNVKFKEGDVVMLYYEFIHLCLAIYKLIREFRVV